MLGKQLMSNLKVNALTFLRDIGHFRDTFNQEVLQLDVLPWLIKETDKHVKEMGSLNSYPTTLIGNYLETKADEHTKQVKAYAEMIKNRRAAEQKAREDKISEKQRRKEEKEAKRKAEEIARLREEIKEKFIDKVVPIEEILKQEITEVDGWS